MHSDPMGERAVFIGTVTSGTPGLVTFRSEIGTQRVLGLLTEDPCPRIS
jgi:hydrogenase maturation factor